MPGQVCKIDSPPDVGPDRFQDEVCQRKSPPVKRRDRFQYSCPVLVYVTSFGRWGLLSYTPRPGICLILRRMGSPVLASVSSFIGRRVSLTRPVLQSVSSLDRSRVSLTHPVCNLSSCSSGGEYLLPSPCLYGCSTGHVRETPHSPNVETVSSTAVKRNLLSAERTHRFHHGACKRNSPPTLDETHTSTGLVRDTPLPTKDKIDSKTECVRETPGPLNDETDCRTGRVR